MYRPRESDLSIAGFIGGAIGITMALVGIIAGGIGSLLHIYGAFHFFASGWVAFFISAVGIGGAVLTRMDGLAGGVVMSVAGAVGIYLVGGFFIIPSIILLITGVITTVDSFRPWSTTPWH